MHTPASGSASSKRRFRCRRRRPGSISPAGCYLMQKHGHRVAKSILKPNLNARIHLKWRSTSVQSGSCPGRETCQSGHPIHLDKTSQQAFESNNLVSDDTPNWTARRAWLPANTSVSFIKQPAKSGRWHFGKNCPKHCVVFGCGRDSSFKLEEDASATHTLWARKTNKRSCPRFRSLKHNKVPVQEGLAT